MWWWNHLKRNALYLTYSGQYLFESFGLNSNHCLKMLDSNETKAFKANCVASINIRAVVLSVWTAIATIPIFNFRFKAISLSLLGPRITVPSATFFSLPPPSNVSLQRLCSNNFLLELFPFAVCKSGPYRFDSVWTRLWNVIEDAHCV